MSRGPRVLVVDDEPQILRFLKPSLSAAGYEVDSAATGAEALRRIVQSPPDALLLDLGLPDMDGKDVVVQVRGWSRLPIIILSVRDEEAEKIAALDAGADDFVNKPFAIGELLARVRAVLRRRAPGAPEPACHEVGPLRIDLPAHRVTLAGEAVPLTPKEFDLLAALARHPGRVMTHRQLLTEVWGPAHVGDTQYLRVFIGQLRQKLEADAADPALILTEPGVGYRLAEPE